MFNLGLFNAHVEGVIAEEHPILAHEAKAEVARHGQEVQGVVIEVVCVVDGGVGVVLHDHLHVRVACKGGGTEIPIT